MKQLCNFINEKLKINKHSRLHFDPDNLCDENVVFDLGYDFYNTPKDLDIMIDRIDDQFSLYCSFKFTPLSKLDFKRTKDQDALMDIDSFQKIYERIVTGRDFNYELHFINGHIEIHCINSGSRAKYYIYAINDDFEEMLTNAYDDDNFDEILSILQTDENIIKPIIYEKL